MREEGETGEVNMVPASQTSFSNVRHACLALTYEGVHLGGGSVRLDRLAAALQLHLDE